MTALFADIKGSTELEQDLDPEEARAIVDPALKLMIDAVRRYDGYVVQSTGDGIFAMFGAPLTHEDHPQRAIHSAMRMQDEIRRYADRLRAEGRAPLQIRVGANTGEVVVRSIPTGEAKAEYTAIGHPVNLASRMQTLANPGTIVIAESTRKLVEGYFTLKFLGASRVKGVNEPVNVYEVTGLGPLRTRLQRSAGRGYTKFVGRQREMEAMKAVSEQAKAGHGQIVAAVAEPGVGKSRLIFEFKAVSQSGWMVLEAFSVSHGKASPFLPVIDLLWSYFKITSDDDERTRREKVTGRVLALDRSLEDAIPYLYGLLGLTDQNSQVAEVEAQTRKRRSLEAIKRILLRESLNQALIVIFEDLHWIDSESQAFLNLLADGIGTARILMLVNYRPEYHHEWGHKTYYTQLRLDPLGIESASEMLSALLGDGAELGALKRLIIERTEGNPFFMEETVQVLFDDGGLIRNGAVKLTRPLNQLKIPPTVQAILASRIDRLAPDQKDLLQTLAVIGTEFKLGLVCQVAAKTAAELEPTLSELQLGEFIYEQPAVGDIEYIFKHALTHDVAYNSVLNERRRILHGRIGAAIEALYADRSEDHISSLARHYARSANPSKAVEYCLRACRQSSDRASYAEAVGHFETGLARLRELPDDDHRAELELDLRNTVDLSLSTLKGWGSPDGERFAARALELCRRPGVAWEKSWTAIYALYLNALFRDTRKARELAAQMLAIAEQHENHELTAESVYLVALSLMFAGEFEPAERYYDQAILMYEEMPRATTGLGSWRRMNQFAVYGFSALNPWFLGFPDRAAKKMNEALAMARGLDSKAVAEAAHTYPALLFFLFREHERVRGHADAMLTIATELGNPFRRALGEFYLGWADSIAHDRSEGIARMQRAVADLRASGALTLRPAFLSYIAQAQCQVGQYEEALIAIDEALALVEEIGERNFEAEVHRIKGESLLAKDASNSTQAEQSFRTAIEIARRQKAKSWELRATSSLARLLRDTNRRDEARAMLAEIYNWFTEGFDTADLKDAKALLDELGS